jgi:hypothetical protein
MEFPTDVLSHIREFAKPLPRRAIGKFWDSKRNVFNGSAIEDMIKSVKSQFLSDIIKSYVFDGCTMKDLGWVDGKYILRSEQSFDTHDFVHLVEVHFTMDELLKWNGKLIDSEDEEDVWVLEEDELHYQVYTTEWKTIPTLTIQDINEMNKKDLLKACAFYHINTSQKLTTLRAKLKTKVV